MADLTKVFAALAVAGGLSLAAAPAPLAAQGGFAGVADPNTMDTLSGAPVGGGGNFAVDRARGVAGGDPFAGGGDPFAGGAAAGDPFGGGGGFGAAGGQGGFGAAGAAGFADPAMGFVDPAFGGVPPGGGFGQPGAAPQQPEIPKIQAIYGTRVVCRVTGQMLSDAAEIPVLETFRDRYFDDGESGMDLKANDFIYTNVTLKDDVMSPEAHLVKTRIIQGLRYMEDTEPNRFYNVLVASSDPLAQVPQIVDLESDRDRMLARWAETFLQDFRKAPEESTEQGWDFYETHLPAPPLPPRRNVPPSFYPPLGNTDAAATEEGQFGGAGFGGVEAGLGNAFGTNNIQNNPAASSGYFGGGGRAGGK